MDSITSSYIDSVVNRASNRVMLDVGCGTNKEQGWIGMDSVDAPGVDVVHSMVKFPWPFEDNSIWHIRCVHVMEHVPMTCMCCEDQVDPLFRILDEFWRILEPGGKVRIVSPHASNTLRAWRDPTHRRAITEETFHYANAGKRVEWGVSHYPVACDFQVSYGFVTDEHGVIQDINVELMKP